jgi:hypothetical protein
MVALTIPRPGQGTWTCPALCNQTAGQPGHAYSMLSRLSRFSTAFCRDIRDKCPAMSRLSRGGRTDG